MQPSVTPCRRCSSQIRTVPSPAATGRRSREVRPITSPHLAVGAGWQTTLTYINYSPEEVTCRTEFLSGQGTPLMVSFPSLGPDVHRTDALPPGGSVHEETNVGLSAALAARLGSGHVHGAGEGQPAVSSVRQRRRSGGGSGSQCGSRSGHPFRHLCRTGARSAWDRSCLCQSIRHGGRGHLYSPRRDGADATQRQSDPDAQWAWGAKYGGTVYSQQLYGIARNHLNPSPSSVCPSMPKPLPFLLPATGRAGCFRKGTNYVLLPHLAVGASWQTTITYINYSRTR